MMNSSVSARVTHAHTRALTGGSERILPCNPVQQLQMKPAHPAPWQLQVRTLLGPRRRRSSIRCEADVGTLGLVHAVDHLRIELLNPLALKLLRRCQLACLLGKVRRQDREL